MLIKKLKRLFFIIFFLIPNIALSDEDIAGFTEAISEVQDKFTELSAGKSEEAKIIDEAIKEINKAAEFAKQAVASEDNENALNVLNFINKSLSDVSSLVPNGGALFESDMSKADMTVLNEEQMADIQIITTAMKGKKEDDLNLIIQGMTELNKEGFNSFAISGKLNQLGVDTIKVDVYLKDQEEMKGWTKEQWADSYKGTIITSTGEEIITGNEIETKVVDLEQQLQKNNLVIAEKRTSLLELESKINPLNSEIGQLKAQRDSLTSQYNSELATQASKTLSDAEINENKTLADSFKKELASLSGKINKIETQSTELQTQVVDLNLQLANEVASSNQLSSQINLMNGQLSDNQKFISMREVELDELKKSSPDIKANTGALNQELQNVSLQRDFIQTQFERSIDKEVEHLKVYGRVLGDTEAEMEFSLREVDVILDSDPRRARAFEIEKYGTYAGLSPDAIQNGITAIQNDDWGTQKELYKEVITKLSKNPNWVVNVPSNAELNVMIAEEQALQNAVFAAIEGQKIKDQVDKIINEKTSAYKEVASLNTTWVRYANIASEKYGEGRLIQQEIDKLLENSKDFITQKQQVDELKNSLADFEKNQDIYIQEFNREKDRLKQVLQEAQEKVSKKLSQMNESSSQWSNWRHTNEFSRLERASSLAQRNYQDVTETFFMSQKKGDLSTELYSASNKLNIIENSYKQLAKENALETISEAKNQIEEITKSEIAKADGYNYVDKVKEILGEVPTFSEDLQRIEQKDAWNNAFVYSDSIYDDPAALRAAMEGANDLEAYEAARDAMQKIGEVPVSQYMTGPYWEMSNVKVAAIVRSKKYDYVDDYAYLNAYYEDHAQFTSAERIEAEEELSRILGKDNPRLNALNKEIANLSNEIKNTNNQSINIDQDIAKLENELKSLKTSENQLQSQITDLTKEFSSKEKLITQNKAKLADFQKQLDPINSQMKGLETEKTELNIKLEQQLNTIADQIKSKGQATTETDQLKKQFESQIANIDDQLKQFEKESENITVSVASINNELNSLEVDTPKLSKQISNLNEDLKNFVDVKANMAIAQAQQYGLEVSDKVINSIGELDNKSIVTIDGSSVFKIVDTSALTDKKGDFITPMGTLTVKGQVYTAGAVQPDRLFSVENIDTEGDIKVSFSQEAAKQIQKEGMLTGGQQNFSDNTLGSWVLVNAVSGEQMTNPLTGENKSVVGTGNIMGLDGVYGKQAAAYGGMYVLESLADEKGNISSMCSGGDCSFNVDTMKVLGPSGIEGNVFNESGEGIYQGSFTSAQLNQIDAHGITNQQRNRALIDAAKNNVSVDLSKVPGVTARNLEIQKAAIAYAEKNNIFMTEAQKTLGTYVSSGAKTFKTLSGVGGVSAETLSKVQTTISQNAAEVASEVTQSISQETAEVAQEIAQAVAAEVSEVAQEVAAEVSQVASSVITASDVEAIQALVGESVANWVLVDKATGEQMADPGRGTVGTSHATYSHIQSQMERVDGLGGVYVLESLAGSGTSCSDGSCSFDLGD